VTGPPQKLEMLEVSCTVEFGHDISGDALSVIVGCMGTPCVTKVYVEDQLLEVGLPEFRSRTRIL
jgi:hypothetical protein